MDTRYEQAKKIFLAVCDLDPGEQARRLDKECGDDAELRAQVEALLADRGELATATLGPAPPASGEPASQQQRIGPYRVVREIGRGGMGVVYLGVREDDQFTRQVAIKVLKRGMDTEDILHRFERERQLLAALNHPGIARLYDGGQTEDGLPYFALEFVQGQPIHNYCDTHRLSITERLELFQQVCSAVHYAHQNLVVHRDLKPRNIVVGADGVPKLLDFGIAKLINPEMSMFAGDLTAPDMRLMTPEYASPEQVRGDPITTASDIYSLGVLLYELVTGHRPYRLRSRVEAEIRRVVCEVDPERPSTAVSRVEEVEADEDDPATGTTTITPELVSKVREGRPDRLRRRLAGDIDNIVLMAMRKEPQRRYDSAEQFAADIGRHLDGMPVIACLDTAPYRISKFVRRHRGGVAAAAVIVLLLVGGIGMTSWQANVATAQRDRAETMLGQVLNLAHVFIFDFHDKIAPLDGSLPARELLVTTALECLDGLAEAAGDDEQLRRELASSYDKIGDIQGGIRNPNLGRTSDAEQNYDIAMKMLVALAAERPDDLDLQDLIARSHMHLGDMQRKKRAIARALDEYRKQLKIAEALVAADAGYKRTLALALLNTAWAEYRLGRIEQAAELYTRSLELRQELLADDPDDQNLIRDQAVVLLRLGEVRAAVGDLQGAIDRYLESVSLRRQLVALNPENGRYRRDLSVAHYAAGSVLLTAGRADEAVPHIDQFLGTTRRRVQDNPNSARAKRDLVEAYDLFGAAQLATGDTDRALQSFRDAQALAVQLTRLNPSDTEYKQLVAASYERIGTAHEQRGEDESALAALQQSFELMSRLVDGGGDDLRLQVAKARLLLGIGKLRLKLDDLFEAQNKLDSAGALYEQLLAQQPDHAETRLGMAETLQTIARLEYERGYTDAAIAHCEQARDLIAEAAPGPQAGALRASIEEDLKRYRR